MSLSVHKSLIALLLLVGLTSVTSAAPIDLEEFTSFEEFFPNTAVGDPFSIGTTPERATFSGDAFAGRANITQLYSSGFRAWMVQPGGTGIIDFETNAAEVQFFARTRSSANGSTVITAFDDGDAVIDTITLDNPFAPFQLLSFSGSIDRIEVVNNASGFNQMNAIDDFGYTPIIPPTVISGLLIDSPPVAIAVNGNVEIGAGAEVEVTPGFTQASATIESILALTHTGTLTGLFANEGEHLRDGLFVDTITYNASDVTVDILQAAPGDVNGDRIVNSTDIQLILAANSFNNGSGFDWTQGDNNGDGLVNSVDIQNILAANLFGADQYVARPASAATVPEPSSIALLILGAVVLASRRRRRGA